MKKAPSILLRRAEDVAFCMHELEEKRFKVLSISITDTHAIIRIDFTPATKRFQGTACSSTYVKGALFTVHQKMMNNVVVKWLEPHFNAQENIAKVHQCHSQT